MRIYAENGHVVFVCDYCGSKAEIPPAKSKRVFMRALNSFYREHDWSCKFVKERNDRIELSANLTHDIIQKLTESCR
jgi:hypothetical protein